MKRLLTAAKVHKLDRLAVGYLVAAWVVVQAGSIALPAFEAPPWAMKLLIAGAVVGLPLTLLVAWFWRIGAEPDQAEDNAPHPFWGRTEMLLAGLLAFVVITGAVEFGFFFAPRGGADSKSPSITKEGMASIAVLPFANLSGDPSKRYFSDGIADQLISELSKTPALRVASRTSSFAVAQKNLDVKALGKALNVKAVLEGSVREEGGRVRIAAQLVNVTDGFEVWSNTYDRNLTDILSLQDEIARSITGALTQKLVGQKLAQVPHPKPHQIDPEAYRDYLQAQFFFAQRSEESVKRSIALLENVTQRAPDFAGGYAALADAHATMAFNFNQQTHLAPALYAVKQALALDPNNISALAAHSTSSLLMWKWLTAAQDVRLMQRLGPNNPEVWHNTSIFFAYMGLPDLTLAAAKRAVELDPLSYVDRSNLAIYSLSVGNLAEGVRYAREAVALQPGNVSGLGTLCQALSAAKQFVEANRILAQISTLASDDPRVGDRAACQFWIAAYSGNTKVARQIVDEVAPGYPGNGVPAGDLSTGYRIMGDNAKALEWYRRAYDGHELAVLPTRYFAMGSRQIFESPEWAAVRNRPEVIAWENARMRIAREFGAKLSGS
ncbi:MAG TPA: tetratricopeptide repeat protein [Rhizomicrobium sp.]|nr:tetratricopeptide repeat protein [Rhizomicrobium sp.]